MNLNIWDSFKDDMDKAADGIKDDATKAAHWTKGAAQTSWNWTKGAVNTIGHDVEVAGQKCGSNPICNDIAMKGTQHIDD